MERAQIESLVAATGCAEEHGGYTFLIDPYWTPAQREKFNALIQFENRRQASRGTTGNGAGGDAPGPASASEATARAISSGHVNLPANQESIIPNPKSEISHGWLCIPTGGSSGGLKFARHDEATLGAAVKGFCAHFELAPINVIDVLPPWHVSGLMARVRCAVTGGRYLAWQWKMLEAGEWPELSGEEMISLVPTQLQRLLANPRAADWLRRLKLIALGGGPVWSSLADAARAAKLPVVCSYGMTETAAMVAAQTPTEFAEGDLSSGHAMSHARIEICDDDSGELVVAGQTGVIRILGDSVMRGYFGGATSALSGTGREANRSFITADRGWLDANGRLHIEGRRDDVVITGGEKVNPREVESELRALGIFTDVAVIGLPHPEWGEELIACYPGEVEADFEEAINSHLSRHQRPKRYIAISETDWPRNAQGKLNRAELQRLLLAKFPIQTD